MFLPAAQYFYVASPETNTLSGKHVANRCTGSCSPEVLNRSENANFNSDTPTVASFMFPSPVVYYIRPLRWTVQSALGYLVGLLHRHRAAYGSQR